MSETTSDSLTLTMSHADLTVMAKAMENSVNSMQLEFAELEEQSQIANYAQEQVLDLDKSIWMLDSTLG